MEVHTKSAEETQEFGATIGNKLICGKWPKAKGDSVVLALSGDLGSGKTTFVQGFARGLKIEDRIISPSFIIVRIYDIADTLYEKFYHVDLYRLHNEIKKDLLNIGVMDAIHGKGNIIVIEWADKMKKHLPKDTIWVNFESLASDERKIEIRI